MIRHFKTRPTDNRVLIRWGVDDRSSFVLTKNSTRPCACGTGIVTKKPWSLGNVGCSVEGIYFPAELSEKEALQRALTVIKRYESLPLVYFPSYFSIGGLGYITGKTTDGLLKVRKARPSTELSSSKFSKIYVMSMHDVEARTEAGRIYLMNNKEE